MSARWLLGDVESLFHVCMSSRPVVVVFVVMRWRCGGGVVTVVKAFVLEQELLEWGCPLFFVGAVISQA